MVPCGTEQAQLITPALLRTLIFLAHLKPWPWGPWFGSYVSVHHCKQYVTMEVAVGVHITVVILSYATRAWLDQGSVERFSPLLIILKGKELYDHSLCLSNVLSVWVCYAQAPRLPSSHSNTAPAEFRLEWGDCLNLRWCFFENLCLWLFLNRFYFPRTDTLKAFVNKMKVNHGEVSGSCIIVNK